MIPVSGFYPSTYNTSMYSVIYSFFFPLKGTKLLEFRDSLLLFFVSLACIKVSDTWTPE